MANMTEFEKIKTKLEKSKTEASILAGKRESAVDELKALGPSSVEEGEKELSILDKQITKLENEFYGLVDNFKEKYPKLAKG